MIKKIINGVLILCFLAIWFSVIKRCTGNSKVETAQFEVFVPNTISKPRIIKDTFDLKLINKNPFKSTNRNSPIKTKGSSFNKTNSTNTSKKIAGWPKIEYFGFVKSKKKATKLALIKVNNKLHRVRESQKIEDLFITKAYGDSIIVDFNKQKRTIKINK